MIVACHENEAGGILQLIESGSCCHPFSLEGVHFVVCAFHFLIRMVEFELN